MARESALLRVIAYVADMPRGVTCRKVSEDLGIHRGSVTKWMGKLRSKGLVELAGWAPTGEGTRQAPIYRWKK